MLLPAVLLAGAAIWKWLAAAALTWTLAEAVSALLAVSATVSDWLPAAFRVMPFVKECAPASLAVNVSTGGRPAWPPEMVKWARPGVARWTGPHRRPR